MCDVRLNFIALHIGVRFQLFHHYLLKNYHFLIELLYRKSVLLLMTFFLTVHYISLYFSFFIEYEIFWMIHCRELLVISLEFV